MVALLLALKVEHSEYLRGRMPTRANKIFFYFLFFFKSAHIGKYWPKFSLPKVINRLFFKEMYF